MSVPPPLLACANLDGAEGQDYDSFLPRVPALPPALPSSASTLHRGDLQGRGVGMGRVLSGLKIKGGKYHVTGA